MTSFIINIMSINNKFQYAKALEDFYRARHKATLEEILGRITGKQTELLPYDEVRSKLGGLEGSVQQLEEIPIDAIVGSVGRYADFNRQFLPLRESDRERWAGVKVAMDESAGLEPIEVYQIGSVYFVKDGNHRVSVARQTGAAYIQAYVTQVNVKVPLSPEDKPEDVIIKAEYTDFLKQTRIDEYLPGIELKLTIPGQYPILSEHISTHRYLMGLELKRPVRYREAIIHWYEKVYLPVVRIILARRILDDFPGRTETDLYMWITEHQWTLKKSLGWNIDYNAAAIDLTDHFSQRPIRVILHKAQDLIKSLTPDSLEKSPEIGEWRRYRRIPSEENCLFERILVTITGDPTSLPALDLGVEIARREMAWLGGLHVIPNGKSEDEEKLNQLKEEFKKRCQSADIQGKFIIESGNIAKIITERSRWTDLNIIRLAHPPPLKLFPRLNSGLRVLIRRCLSPILAVSGPAPELKRILLAFDNSPKANEALYVAAYLADRWKMELTVISNMNTREKVSKAVDLAQQYLDNRQINAGYIKECTGDAAELILDVAHQRDANLIIMGGYGSSLVVEALAGSTVDRVLASTAVPVLICK
jgi:nucleotide-binding universal stress UspA family protein